MQVIGLFEQEVKLETPRGPTEIFYFLSISDLELKAFSPICTCERNLWAPLPPFLALSPVSHPSLTPHDICLPNQVCDHLWVRDQFGYSHQLLPEFMTSLDLLCILAWWKSAGCSIILIPISSLAFKSKYEVLLISLGNSC